MTFAYRLVPVWAAIFLSASPPSHATEPKLDAETCAQLRLEHMKYVASGAAVDFKRGPEWGKTNLSQDKLHDLDLFIQLEEQINFGCRDAKLTLDAERAAEAAKRLELNSDLDPTAPLNTGIPSTGDSDGTGDAPAAKHKLKPKAERKHKSEAAKADAKAPAADDDAFKAPAAAASTP